jgi:cytochrome P450
MDLCKATAGEVIGRIFFGESLGQYTMQNKPMTLFLADLIARIAGEPYNPLYLMFGLKLVKTKLVPRHRKLMDDIQEFREWCRGIVVRNMNQRQKEFEEGTFSNKPRKNMFDILFEHNTQNPSEALTTEEMIDEYITFFF